jgi:hypothetical protein
MSKNGWVRGVKMGVFALVGVAAASAAVMLLWNWLLPELFGWRTIDFWQAFGLLLLSKLLVGGPRGHLWHRMHWRARMMERWEQMTPEERAKFRDGARSCCGHSEPATQPRSGGDNS